MSAANRQIVAILVLLGGCAAASMGRSAFDRDVRPLVGGVRRGVDPNSAPWWELTALPGVGESTARNIIAFRESYPGPRPVFRDPRDLEPVPDIGLRTIRRIAPHLRFDAK